MLENQTKLDTLGKKVKLVGRMKRKANKNLDETSI